jgi:hypothetical protein
LLITLINAGNDIVDMDATELRSLLDALMPKEPAKETTSSLRTTRSKIREGQAQQVAGTVRA